MNNGDGHCKISCLLAFDCEGDVWSQVVSEIQGTDTRDYFLKIAYFMGQDVKFMQSRKTPWCLLIFNLDGRHFELLVIQICLLDWLLIDRKVPEREMGQSGLKICHGTVHNHPIWYMQYSEPNDRKGWE